MGGRGAGGGGVAEQFPRNLNWFLFLLTLHNTKQEIKNKKIPYFPQTFLSYFTAVIFSLVTFRLKCFILRQKLVTLSVKKLLHLDQTFCGDAPAWWQARLPIC